MLKSGWIKTHAVMRYVEGVGPIYPSIDVIHQHLFEPELFAFSLRKNNNRILAAANFSTPEPVPQQQFGLCVLILINLRVIFSNHALKFFF